MTKYDEMTGHSIANSWDVLFDGFDSSKSVFTPKGMLGAFTRAGRRHKNLKSLFVYTATGPTRILHGFDVWMKALPEFAEQTAITYRLDRAGVNVIDGAVTNENILDAHIESEKNMLGNTYEEVLAKKGIIQDVTGTHFSAAEMKRLALIESYSKRMAEVGAFQTDPSNNGFTKWAMNMKQKHPITGNLFFPFVRTVSNVAHVTTEFVPTAPVAEAQGWDRVWHDKEGVFARTMPAELYAKQMFGLFTFMMIWALIFDEDRLTGPPPRNKAERESRIRQNIPNFAYRPPGTNVWIEYRRFEPFGTVLAMAATLAEDIKRIQEDSVERAEENQPDQELFEKVWFVARDISDVFMNSHWAQGAMDLTEIVVPTATEKEAERGIGRLVTGLTIPMSGFFRWVNSLWNQNEYGGVPVETDASIADYVSRSSPYAAMFEGGAERKPGIDGLGQKIVRQARGGDRGVRQFLTSWTPFNYTIMRPDPIEQQFIAADTYPGTPERKVNFKGQLGQKWLDEDIYIEYCVQSGHDVKEEIKRRLTQLQKTEDPKVKKILLDKIFVSSRLRAKNAAMEQQKKRWKEQGKFGQ